MVLWNRKKENSPPPDDLPAPECSPNEPLVEGLNAALDTIGALLREYGLHAFDTDAFSAQETRELCDQWARHLLSGSPRPGHTGACAPLSVEQRDWRGARQFFAAHRREEARHVAKSSTDLRQSLWVLVQALDATVAQDEASDQRVQDELEKLKAAAQSGSTESIRRAVTAAAVAISRIAEERKQQQRAQIKGMYSKLQELGEQLEVARLESALDPLTGLYNRRAFDARLAQALTMCRVFDQPACLLMVDIDHFKRVNDTFGHVAGDQVLKSIADCIARTFRVKNDFVARYGGEEFAVILWNTPLRRGAVSAERLLEAIRATQTPYDGHALNVTASIGIAEVSPSDTAATWTERADRALYQAKSQGRNRVCQASLPQQG